MKTKNLIMIAAMAAALLLSGACKNRNTATVPSEEAVAEQETTEEPQMDMSKYIPEAKAGDEAFCFEAVDSEGGAFDLSYLRGKYVLLDFWASWCSDCRREIPAMKELYTEFAPKGVEFVSFSFDHEEEAWKGCLAESEMPWKQVSNLIKWHDNPVSEAYGIHWIPTMFLIDPEGRIAAYAFTAAEMKPVLEAL